MKRSSIWMTVLALLLAGCGREESAPPPAKPILPADRLSSLEGMMRGARVYQEQCGQCHGPDAQGHPDWQNPKVAAAPPLNGSGNEWKRTKAELVQVILHGVKRDGVPVMPSWKGRVNEQEVEDVITWFQALWPAEIYEKWHKANAATIKDAQVPREPGSRERATAPRS